VILFFFNLNLFIPKYIKKCNAIKLAIFVLILKALLHCLLIFDYFKSNVSAKSKSCGVSIMQKQYSKNLKRHSTVGSWCKVVLWVNIITSPNPNPSPIFS